MTDLGFTERGNVKRNSNKNDDEDILVEEKKEESHGKLRNTKVGDSTLDSID